MSLKRQRQLAGIEPSRPALTEAKIKAQWTKENREGHVYKYDFTGRKADRYKTASFAWLKKQVEVWTASNKPDLWIQVGVWDRDGHAAHDKYAKRFAPGDLAKAKAYGKKLVETGVASLVDIQARIRQSFSHRGEQVVLDFGNYEPER